MFTKKDLKDGMVVETRDGLRYIVVSDRLLSEDGFLYIDGYNNNLLDTYLNEEESQFDVMKVFDGPIDRLSCLRKENEFVLKCLFDRNRLDQQHKNNDQTKYFCKELANTYDLNEDKLYSYFLNILYDIFGHDCTIKEFDIEKCSEADINKAICELGKECAIYYFVKTTERD